ncbi:MAG: asparagine synthase-related protein [Xanthobacteraceae bacterium]
MSGIAGVFRFDGRPVSRHELNRVASALGRYGPDRSDIMVRDTVALVRVLMRMTPEDRFDNQPLQGRSGALVAADLRLDNRDDMLARIGTAPQEAAVWADSRVLLAAWEKLGDQVWPLLRGPFAVAIWEPDQRTLTLARDHLGLNVLMWHRCAQFFAFASMPAGLFALNGVPRLLNEEKFADFLVLNHADHATTIYRDVFRVPPAHVLQVSADSSVRQRQFWSAAAIEPVRLSSDQAYAEGLRSHLDQAVRRQLRSVHPVGCLVTGGLDSSSVCALAARALGEQNKRLAAFTGVPRDGFGGRLPAGTYADETPYVDAIARTLGNVDVEYVRDNAGGALAALERFFMAMEGPVRNPGNLDWMLAILLHARSQGRRVLLGGLYGNHTISWDGWAQTAAHLKQARLFTALRQWRLYYRRTGYSAATALRKLIIEPAMPKRLADWLDRRRGLARRAPWQDHSPINADFARLMGVEERARKVGHDFLYRVRSDERIKRLTAVDYAGDWFAAEKAVTGVEVRDPTADIDVVAYCLGVPAEQYLVEGIDRSLIRRAMWGLLPEMVLTNRLSGLQMPDWNERLENQRDQLARQVAEFSSSALVRRMIDVGRLENALKNWPTGGWHTTEVFQEYNLALTRGVAGGRFLRWFESSN